VRVSDSQAGELGMPLLNLLLPAANLA